MTGKEKVKVSAFYDGYVTYLCFLGAALGVAVQYIGLLFQQKAFYQFAQYSLENLQSQTNDSNTGITDLDGPIPPLFLRNFVYGSNFIGILAIASCFSVTMNLFLRNRKLVTCSLVVMFLTFLAATGFGVLILYALGRIDTGIQEAAVHSEEAEVDVTELSNQISAYTLALYRGCCELPELLLADDNLQVEECVAGETVLDREVGSSCYLDKKQFEFFLQLSTSEICEMLGEQTLLLSGVNIPKTEIPVTQLTDGVASVPIVGRSTDPVFGCGAGYPLAFQYSFFVWFDQQLRPLGVAALAIGLVQTLLLCIGYFSFAPSNDDDDDMYGQIDYLDEGEDEYVRNKMQMQTQQQQQQVEFPLKVDNNMEVVRAAKAAPLHYLDQSPSGSQQKQKRASRKSPKVLNTETKATVVVAAEKPARQPQNIVGQATLEDELHENAIDDRI